MNIKSFVSETDLIKNEDINLGNHIYFFIQMTKSNVHEPRALPFSVHISYFPSISPSIQYARLLNLKIVLALFIRETNERMRVENNNHVENIKIV
jgi:hypothetical protein